jgi:hypothetical protein
MILSRRNNWAKLSATSFSSPRQICKKVYWGVRYKQESVNKWQRPQETWEKGRGDCEDFALLIKELCAINGIQANISVFFPKTGIGHAIVHGKFGDIFWFSSSGSYSEIKSEAEIKANVAKFFSCKEKDLTSVILTEKAVQNYLIA